MARRSRGRGRGRGTAGKGDGAWTWDAARSAVSSRGSGRGSHGGSRDPFASGPDASRHLVKSDSHLKTSKRGRGRGHGARNRPEDRRSDGVCNEFAKNGRCSRGSSCRYQHVVVKPVVERVDEDSLWRHCEVVKAHTGSIMAITMTQQGIYTASLDKSLKRWKPVRRDDGRMELQAELTIQLPEPCASLLFSGGWLFCGLWDGSVRAYSQDGADVTLQGHRRRVNSLLEHQSVLISGSSDGEVRLWQVASVASGAKSFTCTHTLQDNMPGAVSRLHVLGDNLWVGGMSGLAMCNLASLQVTKILPPTKSITDFLEFQNHVIVAYADGGLRIFDSEGTLKTDMKALAAGPILVLAGLESGPRVLVGHAKGQVSVIVLPNFEFKTQFQAFEGNKVESIKCAGHDGIYILGSSDGTLQLWQRIGA